MTEIVRTFASPEPAAEAGFRDLIEKQANTKKLSILEYNPQAAEQAWKRTMAFLDRHLKK